MREWAWLCLGAVVTLTGCATSSSGTNDGSCGDAGVCATGLTCKNGACVGYGSGGTSGNGGSGTGGVGASGGVSSGGSGNFGGSGALGGSGAFGGSGGSGAFGGSGAVGGSGGGGTCSPTIQGLPCSDVWDGTQECGACLVSSCCSPTDTCMSDATCAGLLECLATSCATATDLDACVSQFCPGCGTQDAITKFNAIGTCADANCPMCAEP